MAKEQIMKCFFMQLVLILLISMGGLCQNFELAGIRYNYCPGSRADQNSKHHISIQELGGFFYIPKKLKNDKTIIVNGIGYGFVKIQHLNSHLSSTGEYMKLHAVNYSFMLAHKINEKWSFIGVLKPTLASDFKSDLSTDDFVTQSVTSFTRTLNSNLKLGGGLAYTTRFGDPLAIPIMPIRFNNKRHRVNALLPIKFLYTYELDPDLRIGMKAIVNGANFNIKGYSNNAMEVNKINYTRINIGPVLYYSPLKMIALEVSGGLNSKRTFNPIDYDGNRYKNKLSTGSFINIGLVVIPPNKD